MFDMLIHENDTDYGILTGSNLLLYIKVGNGGEIYGPENRYLAIALESRTKYGCSVLVASNPTDLSVREAMARDSAFIDKQFPDTEIIYAIGHSKGGQMLASYAYTNPKIKRVLSVNAPLMINLHKTKEGILRFCGRRMTMVYGEKDQSVRYAPMLGAVASASFGYEIVKNADHGFEGMNEEFCSLPRHYLFEI